MKSKSTIDSALAWANSAPNKVAASRQRIERHQNEWKNTKVINKNDKEELKRILEQKRAFYDRYSKAVDTLDIRASGQDIAYGRIPIGEGIDGYNAIAELIKYSARKTIKGKAAVTKALEQYLNSCFLRTPAAGSFIYRAEFDLKSDDLECDGQVDLTKQTQGDLIRSININLAKNIIELSKFTATHVNPNYSTLLRHGIDKKFCDSFLKLFSKSTQTVEFSFDWSTSCGGDRKSLPTLIVFEETAKSRLQAYKDTLTHSYPQKFKDVAVYIEKKSVPLDRPNIHEVYFKFTVQERQYKGSRDFEKRIFDSLHVGKYVSADVDAIVSSSIRKSIDLDEIVFNLD